MSCTLWLIVEDENDGHIIQAILRAKNLRLTVKIQKITGGSGGISRLAAQLDRLIQTAKAEKSEDDCIVVLHDLDEHKQTDRKAYSHIAQICESEQVEHVIAKDELEAWLLADEGICNWLNIKPQGWDHQPKPSDHLRSLLQSRKKLKYQGKTRSDILRYLNGTGDKYSKSMEDAYKRLIDWGCLKQP